MRLELSLKTTVQPSSYRRPQSKDLSIENDPITSIGNTIENGQIETFDYCQL